MALYYIFCALLFVFAASIISLRRVSELHHGYYGIVLVVSQWIFHWPVWVDWLGIVLLADDAVQHFVEAIGWRGRMDDFTPIHKLGAWIMGVFKHGN